MSHLGKAFHLFTAFRYDYTSGLTFFKVHVNRFTMFIKFTCWKTSITYSFKAKAALNLVIFYTHQALVVYFAKFNTFIFMMLVFNSKVCTFFIHYLSSFTASKITKGISHSLAETLSFRVT